MNNNSRVLALGLSGILTIVFVVLKLIGTINWSWWWVLSPILIDIGFTAIIIIVYALYVIYRT